MRAKRLLEEYKKAYREVVKEERRKGFVTHLAVYLWTNAMLAVINILYSPQYLWFFYPLFGWGIGLTMHYLFGVRWVERVLLDREAKAEYRMKKRPA